MHGPHSTTTAALLEGLHDAGNDTAWREIDARFRPVLIGIGRHLGLTETDAADAAQETLLQFFCAYRGNRYDKDRGRLRTWIIGIARKRIADVNRKRARERKHLNSFGEATRSGTDTSGEAVFDEAWDTECRRVLLWRALDELSKSTRTRPKTIRAFKLFAIDGRPAKAVARDVGMTVQSVHMARFHCLRRLRRITARLAEEYELESFQLPGA